MASSAPADVVVVGAGPSGLFMAFELARHGVRARVLERDPDPHHQARATALQPGTLEILALVGILDDVLVASHPLPYARVFDADLRIVSELSFADAGSRWGFQASLPQYRTEQILTDHLLALGVTVEHGVTVSSIEARDDAVLVAVQRSDGTREVIEADRVIGAGGAASITRESMGAILEGETYPGTALVGDINVRCDLPRDGSALIPTSHGYVLLAPLPQGRWITFVGLLEDDEREQLSRDRSRDAVASAIQRRVRAPVVVEDVAWASLFRMHRRQAPRLADQRRFLLGDAGHLSSPFGGEGLNSGLHDAHNLAWKLALVLRGRGRQSLIDSFAYERESADRHVLEVSDQLHALVQAAVRAQQTGITPAPLSDEQARALTRSRAMLDCSCAGSPLVGEYIADGARASARFAPGELHPDLRGLERNHQLLLYGAADAAATDRLRHRWRGLVDVIDAGATGGEADGAVLVRPDGYIGFRSATCDAAGLRAFDAHLDSYLIPA